MVNLQEPTNVMKYGKPLRLRRGMIKDSTDKMPIIISESLIEQLSEGSCYNMTNMRVQRYLDGRILKKIETSGIFSNNYIKVTKSDNNDDVYISHVETKILAKVVALDLKTLVQSYFCSNCN